VRTQPTRGYSTKAWNPPRTWVSPERIAPVHISDQYLQWLICGLILIIFSFAIALMIYDQSEFNLRCQKPHGIEPGA